MSEPLNQILLSSSNNARMVRVLLEMNMIIYRYPNYGVWCYLIRAKGGVVVFDPGPRYLSPFGGKGLFGREAGNTDRILYVLDTYFPKLPVLYIAASHYHYDHVENGPHLQEALAGRQVQTPPIRLHIREHEQKRFLRLFPHSLGRVLAAGGCGRWAAGKPIRDGEQIPGTTFGFVLFPGHTSGNIGIVGNKDRILIGGYWALPEYQRGVVTRLASLATDECPGEYGITYGRLRQYAGYRLYTYHPVLDGGIGRDEGVRIEAD